jgi:hypothetical protein
MMDETQTSETQMLKVRYFSRLLCYFISLQSVYLLRLLSLQKVILTPAVDLPRGQSELQTAITGRCTYERPNSTNASEKELSQSLCLRFSLSRWLSLLHMETYRSGTLYSVKNMLWDLRFSWRWERRLCSSGFRRSVDSSVDTYVSKKNAQSFFRAEKLLSTYASIRRHNIEQQQKRKHFVLSFLRLFWESKLNENRVNE